MFKITKEFEREYTGNLAISKLVLDAIRAVCDQFFLFVLIKKP
jgi:hypothetical protein